MKTTLLNLLVGVVTLTSMPLTSIRAAVIFSENFDNSPPYSDDAAIPTGLNTINYGMWSTSGANATQATTVNSTALSATRSMELQGVDVTAGAYFGTDNTAAITTADPIAVRFAFNLTSTAAADVYVRTANHTTVALIQFSGGSKYARINNNNSWNTSISLDLDTWYYAELILPGDPGGTGNTYSMTIYESDGVTQHGATTSGNFMITPPTASPYRYVNFAGNAASSLLYFDNITVNTIPEPATAMLLIGASALFVWKHRRPSSIES